MSELFTIVCENIACTAVQDILAAYCGGSRKLQLLGVEIAANGQTTVGNYPLRIRYLPTAVTAGSGGAAVTPRNINSVGASPTFTAARNNTTQATTGGTASDWVATQFNPINGYYWTPPCLPGEEPKADTSGAIIISLDGISGTLNISATAWFREL